MQTDFDDTGLRHLVLMRHATADSVASSDVERALTARGLAAAAEAGRWLAGAGFTPDHAVISPARRAGGTWAGLARGGGWTLEPEVEPGLYTAGPETALDLLRLVPGDVRSLVVIGHNPTVATLASLLDDGEGAPGLVLEMAGGYPAGALTVFSVEAQWADLGVGRATPRAFHVGRS